MSVSVLAGPLASLIPKLAKLLHDEYKLQKHVKNDVKWLHNQLTSINAFFNDIAKVPWHQLNEEAKVWVQKVRQASYDMEDALDTFLHRMGGSKTQKPKVLTRAIDKMSKIWSKGKARRDFAVAVQDIKKHVEEVAKTHQNYKQDQNIMSKPGTSWSTTDSVVPAMHKDGARFVGVNKSSDEVISMLMKNGASNQEMKKVSIVGVGGLGKTTIAKAVYDKLKSQYEHDCGAFVSVGRNPDELVRVLKDILFGLDENKYPDIHQTRRDANSLIAEIQKFLRNKRYFVVVDDVWKVDTWEIIKLALVDNNRGSKVITTTRMLEVAEKAGEVYKLESLSNNDSMELFRTTLLSTADKKSLDYESEDICEKILSKCGGVPLAIITMASLLAGKPEHQWYNIYNSIGFHNEGNREAEDTMTILSYSYDDLPPNLKTCLLYLSKYPEDYLIEKDSLLWKWIAEGFILEEPRTRLFQLRESRLFEIGETYFRDLINRSLIQPVETWDGRVLGCRVHDMVLDLIRKISSEENFIAILADNVEGQSTPCSVRRLAHQYRIVEHIKPKATDSGETKVRSYTAIMCYIDKKWVQTLSFKPLRVLDLVHCSFEEGCCFELLGDLLLLRYLGIRCGSSGPELPEQIGNLKSLQVLDVDTTTLPESIVQLTGLLRLCAEQADAPDGIGALTSLEELRIGRANTVKFIQELGSLGELRVLRFSITEMDRTWQISAFVKSLRNLKKIQHIHLFGDSLEFDIPLHYLVSLRRHLELPTTLRFLDLSFQFSKFPSEIGPSVLRCLSYLTLRVITMGPRNLELLALLPELQYLWLEKGFETVTASDINNATRCFQKLRYFKINAMVLFQRTNDTSVSMHLWSGIGPMPFSWQKRNKSFKVLPYYVMPKLEVLQFYIPLRPLKNNKNCDYGNIVLDYLPSLREVTGWVDYHGMSAAEGDAMLAALRNACRVHPNNPTLDMLPRNKQNDNNVSAKEKEGEQQQQEEEEASQRAHTDLRKPGPSCS